MPSDSLTRQTPASSFRWNDLPGELKNQVYEELLLSESPIYVSSYHSGPSGWDLHLCRHYIHEDDGTHHDYANDKVHPNILLANKKTYNEAASFLYANNNIGFCDPYTFDRYMLSMQQRSCTRPSDISSPLNLIAHITLSPTTPSRGEQSLLYRIDAGWRICVEHCPNLRTITLDRLLDIANFADDAHGFAAWGGFRRLVDKRGERNGAALVDGMIEVSGRAAGLWCLEKHGRLPGGAEVADARAEAETDVRAVMKRGLAESDFFPALPGNHWDV